MRPPSGDGGDAAGGAGPAAAQAERERERDLERAERAAQLCPFCLELAAENGVRAPCGLCAGSMGLIHPECLRNDLQVNARAACTVCNAAYTIVVTVSRRTRRERLRVALCTHWAWLLPVTLLGAALTASFGFVFSAFLRGVLPNAGFPVRDPLGAQWLTLVLAIAGLGVLAGAWHSALNVPAEVSSRVLMSAPDDKGARTPLFDLPTRLPPPPPRRVVVRTTPYII